MEPAFSGEMMLLNWSETSNGGAKVVLALADAADLEPFKNMTIKRGNVAGQRLACVMVQIGDDERPVKPEKPLSVQAALLCKTSSFQEYVERLQGFRLDSPSEREHQATLFLRNYCQVNSRAVLDTNGQAGARFHMLAEAYRAYMREQGGTYGSDESCERQ